MWEVQPTLYWRVKRGAHWKYERARYILERVTLESGVQMRIVAEPPRPPGVDESE